MAVNSFNAQNPPVTTKGDVFTFSTIPTRLGVGANNTVLTADSSTATGLKWATSSNTPLQAPRLNSNYYVWPQWTSNGTSAAIVEDVTHYLLIYLPTCTIDRIGFRTSGTFNATSVTTRIGLYNNGANNVPTTVAFDVGTVNATASLTNYEITVSQSITAGYYWTAFNTQTLTGSSNNTFIGTAGSPILGAVATGVGFSTIKGYTESGITGAFTTAGTLTATTDALPFLQFRIN